MPTARRRSELAFTGGLAASALLLLAGLLSGQEGALRAGTLILVAIPVARLAVVAVHLLRQREWAFAVIALWLLTVLASSVAVALHVRPTATPSGAGARATP